MNLLSKVLRTLLSAPDVRVTMRPLTERRRIDLVLATAADESELEELRSDMRRELAAVGSLAEEAKAAREAGRDDAGELMGALNQNESARRFVDLHGRAAAVQRRIDEAVVRSALVAVDGFTVDGEAVDVDGFIEYAPVDVFGEVAQMARANVGMSEEDRGNSESLITSAA